MNSHDLSDALRWISDLLNELDVPFQVVGGLAAMVYGASRPLVDIDMYVPDAALHRIAMRARPYLEQPPYHHVDSHWDLTFMKLRRSGWIIELAGADSAKVWNSRTKSWKPANIRFEAGRLHHINGVALRIMPKGQLVEYKRDLGRDVDKRDLSELLT